MTAIPVDLAGPQCSIALIAADLQIVQQESFERPRELQIAKSHLLSGLGESLYDYSDKEHRSQRRNVYVARDGARVVTLCYRHVKDSGSLQIAYDSTVDKA